MEPMGTFKYSKITLELLYLLCAARNPETRMPYDKTLQSGLANPS